MAAFPEITARNYSVRRGLHTLYQEPILTPRYPFQYTSHFEFYPLGSRDFVYLDPPSHHFATLRSDLAVCLWESLKMKVRYILAAARNGDCNSVFDLLVTFVPKAKLQEIDMLPPPFPPADQLTSNPFLRPGHPAVIETRVSSWQTSSRMLTAWIAKAQANSARIPNCSWSWPPSLHSLTLPIDSDSDSGSTDIASTTTEFDSEVNSAPLAQAVLARRVHAEVIPAKRARDLSPVDSTCDGDEACKKQLVLWRPTVSQLLEAQHALSTGEVPSGCSISSTPRAPPCSPSSALDPRLRINDPRLHTASPAQARHALASSLACLQRLHQLIQGSSAD